jgi:hypothetical protein
MKTIVHIIVVIAIAAALHGCRPKGGGFPLSVETLQKIDSGSIEFEAKHGRIFVRTVDKFHDCHVHVLNYDGMSKSEALALLKKKQQELKAKNPNNTLKATK